MAVSTYRLPAASPGRGACAQMPKMAVQWAVDSNLAQSGFAVDQRRRLPSQGCHALGVALVKPGRELWNGPLSP